MKLDELKKLRHLCSVSNRKTNNNKYLGKIQNYKFSIKNSEFIIRDANNVVVRSFLNNEMITSELIKECGEIINGDYK